MKNYKKEEQKEKETKSYKERKNNLQISKNENIIGLYRYTKNIERKKK